MASASPQRRRLLKKLGLPFRVAPSRVSERSREKDPRRLVIQLARRKAESVSRRFPKSLVLGADTIVVCRGEVLVKPRDLKDSERILRLLNGRTQTVYTGIAVARRGRRTISSAAATKVRARKLGEKALSAYFGKHMDKAGSYAVQDRKDPFIAEIKGDLDNVIGLPVQAVKRLLRLASRRA